jgi:hypothetical protein
MSADAKQPSTLKDAAARLILGEIVPLVDKVDLLTASLRDVHECLDKDLQRIGAVVTTFENIATDATQQFAYLIDQARTVQTVIARFESTPKAPEAAIGYKQIAVIAVICSMLSAAVTTGAVLLFNRDQAEQARVGRAVQKALPLLDDSTRQKLQAAVNKTGS